MGEQLFVVLLPPLWLNVSVDTTSPMTPVTSITKTEPGRYGFIMKATTPSGREFIVVILHATWVMDLGVNVQFLTPPELRSCESCFYAAADSSLLKSNTLHFKFDSMHELIAHLDTL